MSEPRLTTTLTIKEIASIWALASVGRFYARQEETKHVQAVLDRVKKRLIKYGISAETVEGFRKLL